MTPFDREVRAAVYALLLDRADPVDASTLAGRHGWERAAVDASLAALADEHRLALGEDGSVWMAHPFSGVPTKYRAVIGSDYWHANCAWDALAILALLGDGDALGPAGLLWRVEGGRVTPDGIVHLMVPARAFWDDIGFT